MTTNAERWKVNTAARRARLIAEGGRNIAMTLPGEASRMLDELVAYRKKKDPSFSMAAWITKMIQRDHSEMVRLKQRARGKAPHVKSADRSTEPSTP